MTWLPDRTVEHLRDVADWPDASGTKYEILEKIGRGGMGSVYRARDRELDRDVALKVLAGADAGESSAARLRHEARILARLEHPAIVPVHDVGRLADGRVFYVMKRVRGERLDAYAAGQGSDLGARLRVFERICEAVAFAHSRGVIHRDLKPENIMVGSFGEVLVLDWGLAKILDAPGEISDAREREDGGETHTTSPAPAVVTANGTILGTPGYMAPEQGRGEIECVDARADVYSLGALLRFLLTGRAPDGALAPGAAPRPLLAICERAMAALSDERYGSVELLARDVTRFLDSRPVSAYREGLSERARRLASKYRVPILLVLAYLTVRVILLAVGSGR